MESINLKKSGLLSERARPSYEKWIINWTKIQLKSGQESYAKNQKYTYNHYCVIQITVLNGAQV